MSVISNVIVPITKIVFIGFIIGIFSYGVYQSTKQYIPRTFRAWIKYKILRKDYKEKDVEWCDKAVDLKLPETKIIKKLRLMQLPEKRVWELVFIYRQIRKMKGGEIKDVRQIKTDTLKDL